MNSTRRFSCFSRRSLFWRPPFSGGIYAPGLAGVSAASSEDDIRASLRTFTKVYDLVEQNFAEPLIPTRPSTTAPIPGMLRTLDPHSNFFDPRYFQLLREEQRGHYYGVGMTVGAAQQQDRGDGALRRLAGLQGGAAAGRRHHRGERQAHRGPDRPRKWPIC